MHTPSWCDYWCVIYSYQCYEIPSAITQLSWALPLSYFRVITFLLCRISKLKMNKLGTTVVKNQPFWLLWRPFLYLRLKLNRLQSNSVVTRELIPLFYVELANQHSIQSVQPPLLCGLQYSILWLKNVNWLLFFSHTPRASIFLQMKRIICEYTSLPNNSYVSSLILTKLVSLLLLCISHQQTWT